MPTKLSGEEKAAILLRAIGEDAAAEVMRHLEPRDIRKVGVYMAELSNITKEQETEVMQEFTTAAGQGTIGFEGKEYIKTILSKALGNEKAAHIMESFTSASYPGLETLKWLEPRLVAQMIKIEHPQTVAVVLAHLDPEQAGQVLGALPDHLKPDVSQRPQNLHGLVDQLVGPAYSTSVGLLHWALRESLMGPHTGAAGGKKKKKGARSLTVDLDKGLDILKRLLP